MTLEEAQTQAAEAAGLTGRNADLVAAAGDTTGDWTEYVPPDAASTAAGLFS